MDTNNLPKQKQKRSCFKYTVEQKSSAIKDIRDGVKTVLEASKSFGVPETTLRDALSGRTPEGKTKTGPATILSDKEEEALVQWCISLAKCGFPVKIEDLQNTVAKIVKDDKRETPFTDNRPGKKWCKLFLKRHPEISSRTAEGISKGRAVVTKESILKWFRDLEEFLKEKNLMSIFDDPKRVINGDETSFSLCPKTGKVIGPKGYKNIYTIQQGNEKETITVLMTFNAYGDIAPPMVVFPYVRPPSDVINSMPPDWVLGRSESGWMTSCVFYEYIANELNPWIIREEIAKPVILFIDGHKSHLTMQLSEFCDANDIILYCLLPNATHILQPADVSVFRPIKVFWKKTIRKWQMQPENLNNHLTKITFAPLLAQTLESADMKDTIKNGFRTCGFYPFDCNAVDYSKCVKNTLEEIANIDKEQANLNVDISAIHLTEKVIYSLAPKLEEKGVNVNSIIDILEEYKIESFTLLENSEKETESFVLSNAAIKITDETPIIIEGFLSGKICLSFL